MRFHDSQHQRNLATRGYGLDARILNFNKQTARELSLEHKYAKAFEVSYDTGISDGTRKIN